MIANKISFKFLLLILISISFFTSCITPKKINYLQNPSHRIPQYNDSVKFQEYKINVGDRLFVRIFSLDKKMNTLFNGSSEGASMITNSGSDNADLYLYIVKDDGNVKLPAVGDINVLGKTVREAKNIFQDSIAPFFKDKFSIDVKVAEKYFSIIGSGNSGRFPIDKEKMNIFQALAMAGDIDIYGDRSKIKIIRETNGKTQIKTFDIRSKDIINSEFYYIQDNDVIYIQDVKDRFFSVTSFGTALSTIFSTISFGLFIYNIVNTSTTTQAK